MSILVIIYIMLFINLIIMGLYYMRGIHEAVELCGYIFGAGLAILLMTYGI